MAPPPSQQSKGNSYYVKSGVAGAVAAGFTHVIVVPFDVVKTRMQIDPVVYPRLWPSMFGILKNEGVGALALGLSPTAVGYCLQGFAKYSLYEKFKVKFAQTLGQETAEKYATGLYLLSGTAAEAIADITLAPFEAVRIRMVAQPTWANGTADGLRKLYAAEGLYGWYKGLVPIMAKQIPYTAVKFAVFEATEDVLYSLLRKYKQSNREGSHGKVTLKDSEKLGITLVSGFVGGVASAVASNPADAVLTRINSVSKVEGGKPLSMMKGLRMALKDLGFSGLWRGVHTRMGMVGVMAALQLFVYDSTKVALGIGVSQGVKKREH
ncbi:mitochondrial substrate carrier family protein N [Paraphysoderma sedebokerense]|nr:mitochondrial substrate carrier family protein N [Paraphysoderma sedebokerense]